MKVAPRPKLRDRVIGELEGHAVWLVAGRVVRDCVDVDFTTGGNPERYRYVPRGEIWIEATMSPADVAATIVHECVEIVAMRAGNRYGPAHEVANVAERAARRELLGDAPRSRDDAVRWAHTFLLRGYP